MGFRSFMRLALVAAVFIVCYISLSQTDFVYVVYKGEEWRTWKYVPSSFDWGNRPQTHPLEEGAVIRLPEGNPHQLPRVQHEFSAEELNAAHNETQKARRDAVREAAKRSWRAYSKHAWGRDQVAPQTLVGQDTFAGWGATLVDSLDTLWIMGMEKEFRAAVRHVATIDWNNATSSHCSLFETNIRYLGGLLSAYDLSQEQILLDKAIELGDMLHAGFDTPNHMPANSFRFDLAKEGKLKPSGREASAAVGSLFLEFTRLSQLSGDPKYYHAINGVKKLLERNQDSTKLPGMWPVFVNLQEDDFFAAGNSFSLGNSADSAYEYLSKMHALLGGLDPIYEKLHTKAMDTAEKHVLFRPMLPGNPSPDVLFPGEVISTGQTIDLSPVVEHLGCFAGGMFALGGRLFENEDHVRVGEQLARGCAWAYDAFSTGVMPERAELMPCEKGGKAGRGEKDAGKGVDHLAPCVWNETRWWDRVGERKVRPPQGFASVLDQRYLLRPEAIESVFVLYRITGKADLLDVAWRMFESITRATRTKFAYSAIADVQATDKTSKLDSMESFWIAETLKYFYLIFSEPELISLDDYVFNTEAHPFRLPKPSEDGQGQ
ncbi:glycoside hydrolase [Corynascus similis CBS 632.67]